ncbi:cell division protein ZapA [Dyadobacter subterraneus]|uniref:Cell division protein ZapA n=1 Tax=Dyadobacter subterraneus TaxID=2773304 RepID=A0ABR9WF41_9BACT|nr:cell division protein ZapA [Dyadobacter subterraneus]MBE9464113.1 cell division protein ZapA [Dyadobacter subterraneus]
MKNNHIPNPDVSVFIKILDRGFKLSVPADQEIFYREGYDTFMERVRIIKNKGKGKGYDDIEAIALASIECLVALQRNQVETERLMSMFDNRVNILDEKVSEGIPN